MQQRSEVQGDNIGGAAILRLVKMLAHDEWCTSSYVNVEQCLVDFITAMFASYMQLKIRMQLHIWTIKHCKYSTANMSLARKQIGVELRGARIFHWGTQWEEG